VKQILAINGSASENSSNLQLLEVISATFSDTFQIAVYDGLWCLPLFNPNKLREITPVSITQLKNQVDDADAIVISTPEYLHNVPAVLKNALEWMTESGELADKPVLPITFTPHEPRGKFAMTSLIQSLKASKATIVAELPLYQNRVRNENREIVLDEEYRFLLGEALKLL